MKKIEFINGDKMKIETGVKIFDKQTNLITTGSAFCNTQKSMTIRAFNQTTGVYGGTEVKKGELQNFDLNFFQADMPAYVMDKIRKYAIDRAVYVYEFYHVYRLNRKMVHGYIVTTTNHEFLKYFVTGHSHKSYDVIEECARYISDFDSVTETYKRMTVV